MSRYNKIDSMRLKIHFTQAAWGARAAYRQAKAAGRERDWLSYLDGRYIEARQALAYVRDL